MSILYLKAQSYTCPHIKAIEVEILFRSYYVNQPTYKEINKLLKKYGFRSHVLESHFKNKRQTKLYKKGELYNVDYLYYKKSDLIREIYNF